MDATVLAVLTDTGRAVLHEHIRSKMAAAAAKHGSHNRASLDTIETCLRHEPNSEGEYRFSLEEILQIFGGYTVRGDVPGSYNDLFVGYKVRIIASARHSR